MKMPKAILSGTMIWAFIFVLWSVMIFTPIFESVENLKVWRYGIYYAALIPFVLFGASYYYKNGGKMNGLTLGLVMLATGITLDAIITVPLFTLPQGVGYTEYFINPLMGFGFVEFIAITSLFWIKKVKR